MLAWRIICLSLLQTSASEDTSRDERSSIPVGPTGEDGYLSTEIDPMALEVFSRDLYLRNEEVTEEFLDRIVTPELLVHLRRKEQTNFALPYGTASSLKQPIESTVRGMKILKEMLMRRLSELKQEAMRKLHSGIQDAPPTVSGTPSLLGGTRSSRKVEVPPPKRSKNELLWTNEVTNAPLFLSLRPPVLFNPSLATEDVYRIGQKAALEGQHLPPLAPAWAGPSFPTNTRQTPLWVGEPKAPSEVQDVGGFRPLPPKSLLWEPARREHPSTAEVLCDYFTEDVCLTVSYYPIREISDAILKNLPTLEIAYAEVKNQNADTMVEGVSSSEEGRYNYAFYAQREQPRNQKPDRERDQHGGYLCPSEVNYGYPLRGRNLDGKWKFIVNLHPFTQTVRLEKCLHSDRPCSVLVPYSKTHCAQIYNFHRVLCWSQEEGLHIDIFKFPVGCACHLRESKRGGRWPPKERKHRHDTDPSESKVHVGSSEERSDGTKVNFEYHPIFDFFDPDWEEDA